MHTRPFDFVSQTGLTLSGRLEMPAGAPTACALFAHCFTCSKESLAAVRVARALAARGFAVLRFDFAGLGDSEGQFGRDGLSADVQDLLAAAAALADAGLSPRLLIGHSLGGAAVLAAAGDLPDVQAVATLAAPFDVGHVAGQFGSDLQTILDKGEAAVTLGGRPFTVSRAFVEDLRAQNIGERIAALHRPLLILHAPADRVVDVDNAAMIFQAARHPKSFVSLDDADHLLTREADARYAAEVITAWASRYVAHAPTPAAQSQASDGRVLVEETRAGRFQLQVSAGPASFLADEPVAVGGMSSGPTPYDLLSAGLGACTAITLRMYADRKGLALDRVAVRVGHAQCDGQDPPDLFTRELSMEGRLDGDATARLLQIADRCPVHRLLGKAARIETRLSDAPAALPPADPSEQHVRDVDQTLNADPA